MFFYFSEWESPVLFIESYAGNAILIAPFAAIERDDALTQKRADRMHKPLLLIIIEPFITTNAIQKTVQLFYRLSVKTEFKIRKALEFFYHQLGIRLDFFFHKG
jgi:hypothetical protein